MFLISLLAIHLSSFASGDQVLIKYGNREDHFIFSHERFSFKSNKMDVTIDRGDCIKVDLNNFRESFEQNFYPLPELKNPSKSDVLITYKNQTKAVRNESFQARWALGLRDEFIQLKLNSRLKCY